PATMDEQRLNLGIPLRKEPTRRPIPDESPLIDVLRVDGARVSIRLWGSNSDRRGRPEGVASAGTVWIAAKWFNPRGEGGKVSNPRQVNLPAALALPMGNTVKLAA